MKKINRFFVAVASVLVMAATSCVNENMGGVQGWIDQDSMVASLVNQTASVEASLKSIGDIRNDLSQIAEGSRSNELEKLGAGLAECVVDLEKHMTYLKNETSLLEGTLATMAMQKQLAKAVGSVESYMLMNSDVDFKNLGNNLKVLESSVSAWIGKNYEVYYSAVVADALVDYFVSKYSNSILAQKYSVDAFLSDIEAGLRDKENYEELVGLSESVEKNESEVSELMLSVSGMADQLEEEYGKAIAAAAAKSAGYDFPSLVKMNSSVSVAVRSAGTTLSALVTRVGECEDAINDLKGRLGAVEGDVEGLLGLIQSVSFISNFSSDVAIAYYNLDPGTVDGEGRQKREPTEEFELNYIVRPAAAVSVLADKANWIANDVDLKIKGYYADALEVKSFEGEIFDFTINSVSGNPETGVLTVNVASDKLTDEFFMKQTGAKVSMSLKTGKTDIASRFVELVPKDQSGTVYVESLTLDETTLDIMKDDITTLTATLAPAGITVEGCDWTSSVPGIATVDENGTITAKAFGYTDITATTKGTNEWGQKLTATCRVNVAPGVKLVKTRAWIEVGEEAHFTLDMSDNFQYTDIEWSASNSNANVDQNGVVTGVNFSFTEEKGYGGVLLTRTYNSTTIYCDIYNGGAEPEIRLTGDITVVTRQPRGLILPGTGGSNEINIKKGMSKSLGTPSIEPANVNDGLSEDMRFSVACVNMDIKEQYIQLRDHVITAKEIGNATVHYSVSGAKGVYAPDHYVVRNLNVNVIPIYVTGLKLKSEDVDITGSHIEVSEGSNTAAVVEFTSDEDGYAPSDTKVVWSSSDESVAKVDQNGNISVQEGSGGKSAVITVTTAGEHSVPAGNPPLSVSFTVYSTAPWKSFNVGDYVINDGGTIEFKTAAEIQQDATLQNKVVGIVFAKKNPRVTDTRLPDSCTHGLAVALNDAKDGTYYENKWMSILESVSNWAAGNGYVSLEGWSTTNGFSDNGKKLLGYNNTEAMKAFMTAKLCTSQVLNALSQYSVERPNDTSSWYIPSVAECVLIHEASLSFADGVGTQFVDNYYWTSSEIWGSSNYNAVAYNLYSGSFKNPMPTKTIQNYRIRPIFAF